MVGHGGGVADVAAGEGLAQDENIRQHQVGNKSVPRPAKAGGHLIEDEQDAVLVAQLSGPFQEGDVIHPHPPGPLEQRLDQNAVELVVVLGKGFLQSGNFRGDMHHVPLVGEGQVIVLVVTDLHGPEGIAVVGVLQGQDHGAGRAQVDVILHRHFQGHFHAHAAGVGEEAVVQIAGQKLRQLVRQVLHRLVGQAAQHDVAELPRLRLDGGGQLRMLVPVDHTPPGGDGVDEGLVLGVEIDPLGVHDLVGRVHFLHLLIGIPDHSLTSSYRAARASGSIRRVVSPSWTVAKIGRPVRAWHMARLSSSMVSPG